MLTPDENAIIERIRLLREQYSGTRGKSQFARALGISASSYNYYENNRVAPIGTLKKICELTGVDLTWLLTGQKGEEGTAWPANKKLLQSLDNLLTQRPELTQTVSAFMELLAGKNNIEKEKDGKREVTGSEKPGWIPVLGRTAAGMVHFWDESNLLKGGQAVVKLEQLVKKFVGKKILSARDGAVCVDLQTKRLHEHGGELEEANLIQVVNQSQKEVVEFVEAAQIYRLFPDCFALRIDGDSMSPRINDSDIVIVSASVPAVQGQIAVVCLKNQIGVACKIIRTAKTNVHLIPINERYETKIVLKEDLSWALAVLCHIKMHMQ